MKLLDREVHEGTMPPRGYGLAWRKPATSTAIFYPVPLNWLASWGRSAWFRLKRHGRSSWWERSLGLEFSRGFRSGQEGAMDLADSAYDQGWREGRHALHEEMTARLGARAIPHILVATDEGACAVCWADRDHTAHRREN